MGGDSTEGPARAAGAGYARRHPRLIRVAGAPAYRASRNREGCGMGQRHKILIVDDHPITQSGLRLLLAGQDRYEVIGALDRGATVSAFVRSQPVDLRSEEHTSELQSLMRISYAGFCLKQQ